MRDISGLDKIFDATLEKAASLDPEKTKKFIKNENIFLKPGQEINVPDLEPSH